MATSESESCCAEAEDNDDSIECFQNYSASEVFIQGLAGLVDQQDVESMIRAQKQILQRFEKTNEMLSNCNTLSVTRLKVANQQFKNYKQLLVDVKKDLDYTFKKINLMKSKLRSQYPDSVEATASKAGELNQSSADPDAEAEVAKSSTSEMEEGNDVRPLVSCDSHQIAVASVASSGAKCQIERAEKKTEISDGNSNSSESGEADSHVESISISTSDTA